MAVKQLTPDEIRNIAAGVSNKAYPAPPQFGPLAHTEKTTECLIAGWWVYEFDEDTKQYTGERHWKKSSTGACRSPTQIKVQGVSCCSAHALMMLNALAIDAQFKVGDHAQAA